LRTTSALGYQAELRHHPGRVRVRADQLSVVASPSGCQGLLSLTTGERCQGGVVVTIGILDSGMGIAMIIQMWMA
jgi:hypothetical protein